MAEWGVDPVTMLDTWTLEQLMLFIERLTERRERENEAMEKHLAEINSGDGGNGSGEYQSVSPDALFAGMGINPNLMNREQSCGHKVR